MSSACVTPPTRSTSCSMRVSACWYVVGCVLGSRHMITTHWDAVKRFVSTVGASKLTELAVVGYDNSSISAAEWRRPRHLHMIQLRFLLLRSISSESSLTQARPLAGGTEGGSGRTEAVFKRLIMSWVVPTAHVCLVSHAFR